MSELEKGRVIKTKSFKTVKVVQKLGGGGQGIVYKVDYDGKPMALKWYYSKKIKNPDRFYANIENNIKEGRPTEAFLWPEDITEWVDGTFGYVMPLRPPEYGDFSKYLLVREKFESPLARVNAALNIVEGFMALHRTGCNYQDLNDGNFFVNFKTGDVLICDNDNVMGHGDSSGIAGKPCYMAPEIVRGEKHPDKETDRFSLAVVLFLLLFVHHPLVGKAACPPLLGPKEEKKIYGTDPVFVFDPDNDSNRPIEGIHVNAIKNWKRYPQYIRDAFIKAFSHDLMHAKMPRILNSDWLKLFIRLRDEIIPCACGKTIYADPTTLVTCDNPKCGKQFKIPAYLKFRKANLPLYPAMRLFACHTVYGSDDYRTATAEVILSKNTNSMGIRNLSDAVWSVSGADGKAVPKGKGEVVKVASGLKFDFGDQVTAEIIGN